MESAVPVKIPKGSRESVRLKELALQDSDHWQMTFPEIAKEAKIDISRSYSYEIMANHHDLHRYRPRRKPQLDRKDKNDRITLADWALQQPMESFAYIDESWIEIGRSRSHRNVTRPKGSNPYDFVIQETPPAFSLMVAACISLGYKSKLYIWEKETPEERAVNARELSDENTKKQQQMIQHRSQARIPGTIEYNILQQKNELIKAYNTTKQPDEPRKMLRRPEWEFKEEIGHRSAGEGFDWFIYRKHVLHQLAYPLIEKIQHERGIRVWLVEDNAGCHTAATRIDAKDARRREIYTIPHRGPNQPPPLPSVPYWPANSPDINEIEPVWRYLKDMMDRYPHLQGKSRATIETYKTALETEYRRKLLIDFV